MNLTGLFLFLINGCLGFIWVNLVISYGNKQKDIPWLVLWFVPHSFCPLSTSSQEIKRNSTSVWGGGESMLETEQEEGLECEKEARFLDRDRKQQQSQMERGVWLAHLCHCRFCGIHSCSPCPAPYWHLIDICWMSEIDTQQMTFVFQGITLYQEGEDAHCLRHIWWVSQCSWLLAQSQGWPKGQFSLLTSGYTTSFSIQLLKATASHEMPASTYYPSSQEFAARLCQFAWPWLKFNSTEGSVPHPLSQWPEFILLTRQPALLFCFLKLCW